MVKQFVKLFAIQYGLTFCLYMRSLYEAPLHSPSSISIRQLDLMSKSWNELLRHWWSSFIRITIVPRTAAFLLSLRVLKLNVHLYYNISQNNMYMYIKR